ncbi:class D beta-lactamase [Tateyamaria omphalii]|uniref:penicillin-binding transpeptidase domain-containing protein n=1 Tax=Tateyamaria omphalii TaxID=299262 RepID=UPI001C9A03BD|nr:penicillin-binding transpeptidase domain-containing protein [Tateyamaria omphalii]MBY5935257.1 class D beta-lactamase [Tateyamaria omphalii]
MSSTLSKQMFGGLKACLFAMSGLVLSVSGAVAGPIDVSQAVEAAGVDPETSTIVVQRLSDDQVWVSNADRSAQRFAPASTSKVPHTLIALETGVAAPETMFDWDGQHRVFDGWNRDHTLTSAFRSSVVWVYQEIAQRVGLAGMTEWLGRFDYGNAETGTEATLTTYWLDDTLQITALEQIAFLERLAERDLPLSDATYAAADTIMQSDAGDGWTMYSKTGWRFSRTDMDVGWYVGWVRCSADTYVFALNLDMPDRSYLELRKPTSRAVLDAVGAFECQ